MLYLPLSGDGAVRQVGERGHVVVSEARLVRPGYVTSEAVNAPVAAPFPHVHCCGVQDAEGVPVDPPVHGRQGSSDMWI